MVVLGSQRLSETTTCAAQHQAGGAKDLLGCADHPRNHFMHGTARHGRIS